MRLVKKEFIFDGITELFERDGYEIEFNIKGIVKDDIDYENYEIDHKQHLNAEVVKIKHPTIGQINKISLSNQLKHYIETELYVEYQNNGEISYANKDDVISTLITTIQMFTETREHMLKLFSILNDISKQNELFFVDLNIDGFIEITGADNRVVFEAEFDTDNEECVNKLCDILNRFDFSFLLSFSNCEEIKGFPL